ncbi:phosphoribosyltransferase [Verrucomicrobiota bacterium sgz303538]
MRHAIDVFEDRRQAGQELARHLSAYAHRDDVVVLAIPRGGVPVGYEVATALGLPLDIFVVRKLGMPGHEEYAIGAIASGGVRVLNPDVRFGLSGNSDMVDEVTERETKELDRREQLYREGRPPLDLHNKVALVVDDGLATGSTMRAAVSALRHRGAAKIVVAIPVAPPETCEVLQDEADEVICVSAPENFMAVGQFYVEFSQTSDDEVKDLLTRANEAHGENKQP